MKTRTTIMYVTHEELKTALESERGTTKSMIDVAIEAATERQAGVMADIRASLRDMQRDTARTAVKMEDFEERLDGRFNKIEQLIEMHDGTIRRFRGYESLAVGGINAVGSLPFLRWVKRAVAAVVVVVSGTGLGVSLFMMILR